MLSGSRGRLDTCVDKSRSVILRPFRAGIVAPAGRYFSAGSSSATSPLATMSARITAVNTFEIEPISYTVLPETVAPPSGPPATTRRPAGSITPTTSPSPLRSAIPAAIRPEISSFVGIVQFVGSGAGGGGAASASGHVIPDWLHSPCHVLVAASQRPW